MVTLKKYFQIILQIFWALKNNLKNQDHGVIGTLYAGKGIKWPFITPLAPHMAAVRKGCHCRVKTALCDP